MEKSKAYPTSRLVNFLRLENAPGPFGFVELLSSVPLDPISGVFLSIPGQNKVGEMRLGWRLLIDVASILRVKVLMSTSLNSIIGMFSIHVKESICYMKSCPVV